MPETATGTSPHAVARWHALSAAQRLGVAGVIGVAVAGVTMVVAPNRYAPMLGWDAAAAVFLGWTWSSVWPRDAEQTRVLATREDPSRATMDAILLSAAVVSLATVGFALFGAGQDRGAVQAVRVTIGVASVVGSWGVVHTVFCLKYASLYYGALGPGVDFPARTDAAASDSDHEDPHHEDPDYADFAYLAFTVGMTYQVSDTDLTTRPVRRTALQHALISFLFGTVILAASINLVAGLSR